MQRIKRLFREGQATKQAISSSSPAPHSLREWTVAFPASFRSQSPRSERAHTRDLTLLMKGFREETTSRFRHRNFGFRGHPDNSGDLLRKPISKEQIDGMAIPVKLPFSGFLRWWIVYNRTAVNCWLPRWWSFPSFQARSCFQAKSCHQRNVHTLSRSFFG